MTVFQVYETVSIFYIRIERLKLRMVKRGERDTESV